MVDGEIFRDTSPKQRDQQGVAVLFSRLAKGIYRISNHLGVRLVPYQLRHSGASWDILQKRRDMISVQKRGVWATDRSLFR